ncbi:hypothetical protein QYE76_040334 [Lolium multiflorum]|uniref:Reverse transcriptase Ty1/copia-type domain-containing protein n=1 Tax=Lolium multiflorum TaxID=4521 RepID=A0AAD8WUU4_LOLMU|nr:hypothetical protein QYE76_040334 [Lolium multiflorum]
MGFAARRLWKVFRIVALGTGGFATEALSRRKGRFEMSMMGEMKLFLGFEIKQLREGTFINQAKYLQDMLKRFKMTEMKGVATPMGNGRGAAGLRTAGSRQRPAEEQPAGAVAGFLGSRLALSPSRPGCGLQRCSWAGFYKPYPTGVCTSDRLEAGESCTGRNWVGEPGSKVHADLISRKDVPRAGQAIMAYVGPYALQSMMTTTTAPPTPLT